MNVSPLVTVKKEFPLEVNRRCPTVKIHRAIQVQGGQRYDGFLVVFPLRGKRTRLWRSDLEAAKILAEEKCAEILNGDQAVITLREIDKLVYMRARALLPAGVELDAAVSDYVAAVKDLPAGATLREAVDFFRRRNAAIFEKRTVRQVADEMIAEKRAAGWSNVHLKDLECRLGRFADALQMNISDTSGRLIQSWLNSMNRSGRTKRNYLRGIELLAPRGLSWTLRCGITSLP